MSCCMVWSCCSLCWLRGCECLRNTDATESSYNYDIGEPSTLAFVSSGCAADPENVNSITRDSAGVKVCSPCLQSSHSVEAARAGLNIQRRARHTYRPLGNIKNDKHSDLCSRKYMNLLYSPSGELDYGGWFSLSMLSREPPRDPGLHIDGRSTREVGVQVGPWDDETFCPGNSPCGNPSENNRRTLASGSMHTLQQRASLVLERARGRTTEMEEINRSLVVRLMIKRRGLITLLAYCKQAM